VALGWKNGYKRNELMRMFIAAGFQPRRNGPSHGRRALFRLIPPRSWRANVAGAREDHPQGGPRPPQDAAPKGEGKIEERAGAV